jgi:hypothetical protein
MWVIILENKKFIYNGLDIKESKSKFNAIGMYEELVSRKEDVYLFLSNYLGAVTKDQLCYLANVLGEAIRTSVNLLNKEEIVVDIEKDEYGRVYYFPNRRSYKLISGFVDEEKLRPVSIRRGKKHLGRINDFYISLFKNSDCEQLTIDYNNIGFSDKIVPDAIIETVFNKNKYEIYLEQDNNTERKGVLVTKIANYFNVLLHKSFTVNDTVKYYIFRCDMYLKPIPLRLCHNEVKKEKSYQFNMDAIKKLKELYASAKDCIDIERLEEFVRAAEEFDIVDFEIENDRTFKNNLNRFLQRLSSRKTDYEMVISELTRQSEIEYVCEFLKNRIAMIKGNMLEEFAVAAFDFDSKSTLYNELTGRVEYAAEYEKLDSRRLLLRNNFLCSDIKVEDWLNEYVFNKEDKLIKLANRVRGQRQFKGDVPRKQKFIKIGSETLCFSNLVDDYSFEYEPFTNYVLLMPTISVSDHVRLEYICNSDSEKIESDLKDFLMIYVIVEDEAEERFYNNMISNYEKQGKINFSVITRKKGV